MTHLDYDWETPVWRHWLEGLARGRSWCATTSAAAACRTGTRRRSASMPGSTTWLVVDAARLDRFPLLGVSQGAAVAVAYAVRHPERVSCLVLASAYARGRMARATTDEQRREAELDVELARVGWGRDDADVPPGVHPAVPARRDGGGLGRVQRGAAAEHLTGQRRALPRGVRRHRREHRGPERALPDLVAPLPRRPSSADVQRPGAGRADPRESPGAARQPQPPADGAASRRGGCSSTSSRPSSPNTADQAATDVAPSSSTSWSRSGLGSATAVGASSMARAATPGRDSTSRPRLSTVVTSRRWRSIVGSNRGRGGQCPAEQPCRIVRVVADDRRSPPRSGGGGGCRTHGCPTNRARRSSAVRADQSNVIDVGSAGSRRWSRSATACIAPIATPRPTDGFVHAQASPTLSTPVATGAPSTTRHRRRSSMRRNVTTSLRSSAAAQWRAAGWASIIRCHASTSAARRIARSAELATSTTLHRPWSAGRVAMLYEP